MEHFYLKWAAFICLFCGTHMRPDDSSTFFNLNDQNKIMQPLKQPEMQPLRQPAMQPLNQPAMQPLSQPAMQPLSQPEVQPLGQSDVQPTKEPEKPLVIEPEVLDMLYSSGNFSELARAFQLDEEYHLTPFTEAKTRTLFDLLHNNGRGDIIFSQAQKDMLGITNKRRVARQGVKFDNVHYFWWQRFVPYYISKNFTRENRQLIEDAIFEFNFQVQNEILVPRMTGQRDYIMFIDGNGCSSHIGKHGGAQVVSLSQNGCMSKGTIMHEILHTLGMIHEHTRPDRDDYIKILYENIPEDWIEQYTKYSSKYIQILGDYDYLSVMHYPLDAPGNKGKQAIEVLEKGVDLSQVGQRKKMTETDIKKVKKLYDMFLNIELL